GLLTRPQVFREAGIGVSKPAEIDDPANALVRGGSGEVSGSTQVPLPEIRVAAHAVDQVIRRVNVLHGGRERRGIEHVANRDLDLITPGTSRQAVHVAGENAHLVATLKQEWDQATTDVPGGATDQDPTNVRIAHAYLPWLGVGRPRRIRH